MPIGGQDIVLEYRMDPTWENINRMDPTWENINRMDPTWENNNNDLELPLQGLLFKSFVWNQLDTILNLLSSIESFL